MANPASIRLGTTGKAQVKADLVEIADTGDAQAKRWARSYENAGRDVEAAMERQKLAAAKISAIMPQTAVQMRINDTNGTGFGQYEGSARQSAAAIAALIEQEDQLAARTRALVSSIDPAYAAQQRFNAEMGEARALVSAGTLSLDQYVAKLGIEQRALDQAVQAHKRATVSTGQFRAGTQQLSYQIGDVSASLGSGTSLTQVFAQQIGQTVQAVQLMTGATSGFVGWLAGPWGAAVTGGVILLTMLAGKYMENKEAAEKAEAGMKKFQDRQSDIGNFIDTTTGKLKEQNQALILNAVLTRQAQIADNNKQIAAARGKAFDRASDAALKGTTAAPGTTTSGVSFGDDAQVQKVIKAAGGDVAKLAAGLAALAKTRPDLAKVAVDVSTIGGQAIIAQRDNATLAKEIRGLNGDTSAMVKADTSLIDARAKLAGATNSMDRAQARYTISIREADNAFNASKKTAKDQQQLLTARTKAEHDLNVAQDANRKGGQAHAASLARNASAMEVNASAALDLAKAYLVGGDAAVRAEAMRKGATDATRKGIDAEAQTRRQLDIMIGDQVVSGAKSVAQLRDETAARASVLAQVAAGTLTTDQMNQGLSDEAALRPLLKLQMVAQGEQLGVLNTVIAAYRQELDAAHVSEGRFGLDRALSKSIEKVEELKAATRDLGKTPLARVLDAAQRDAEREAQAQNFPEGPQRTKFINSRVGEAEAQFQADQARYLDDSLRGQRDSIALRERELLLVGANDNMRSAEIDKLRVILDLRQRGIDPLSKEGQQLLANAEKLNVLGASIAKSEAALGELRDFGSSALDTLFSTSSADTWGDRMKSIVGDVKNELIKLVLLNPLKNLINGDSKLPTITSAIGNLSKLFGPKAKVGANATGTEYWGGGISLVGENGPELVEMARGARVTPAAETRRMLATNDNVRGGDTHYHLSNNLMTPEFWEMIHAGDANAAMQGAVGGAAMSQADASKSGARRLGRRW